MEDEIVSWYISQIVTLPPFVARAAFDAVLVDHAPRTVVRVSADPWRLDLFVTPRRPTTLAGPWRGVPGALSVGRWRRHAVELELLAWSADAVELGLRPRLGMFGRRPTERALAAAGDILEVVAAHLHAWADQPLAAAFASAVTNQSSMVDAPPPATLH